MPGAVVHKRKLTAREINFARQVFGSDINLGSVFIIKSRWIFFQGIRTAMSPNGNIYFPDEIYKDGFSVLKVDLAFLLHELTHVWQYQHGENIKSRAPFERKYDYGALTSKSRFADFNMEQQASIVSDYVRLRIGLPLVHGSGAIENYKSVIPFLPKPQARK